jgi:TM2 domain-containing membrane protein YozV
MSFGRKGLGPGESAPSPLRTTRPAADDDIARKREAFLAAERARRAESEGGVSDLAARYPNSSHTPFSQVRPQRHLYMAYLLWFVLGQISAHRFYLGAYHSAIAQVGLFFAWVALALAAPERSQDTIGPVLMVLMIGWILWIVADVFLIRGLHRKLCRQPGEAAAAAAAFA